MSYKLNMYADILELGYPCLQVRAKHVWDECPAYVELRELLLALHTLHGT